MTDTADTYAPVLEGPGESDYERYLRTEELLALQKDPADMAHRDEMLFQVVHQSSELWLKLAAFELEEATTATGEDRLTDAVRCLRRANLAFDLVTRQLDMLDHMSPWEYHQVRLALGHGSGFDSPGWNRTREAMAALGLAFDAAVADRGLTLVDLYRQGRAHDDLYQLAEQLTELDGRAAVWRYRHLVTVQRSIGGGAVGTQGTPVEMLEKLIRHRAYPRLWELRDHLTELANEEADHLLGGGH